MPPNSIQKVREVHQLTYYVYDFTGCLFARKLVQVTLLDKFPLFAQNEPRIELIVGPHTQLAQILVHLLHHLQRGLVLVLAG